MRVHAQKDLPSAMRINASRYRIYFVVAILGLSNIVSLASAANTWQITGWVLQQDTDRPLAGIEIRFIGQEKFQATTNEQGFFQIPNLEPGHYRLQVTGEGYQHIETEPIEVGPGAQSTDILLHLSTLLTLPQMQVEAAQPPQTSISHTTMTGQELEQMPGAAGDPFAALRVLPGITTANDASATIAVRGSGPQDNLAYVDFLEVGYLFHDFLLTSVLRSDLIETFDLYASAYGPEYGNVLGAVIDVKQRDPRADRLGSAVNISIIGADALVEGPVTENSSFYLAARRSYIDLILPADTFSSDDVEITELPVFSDYQAKYLWRANPYNTVSLQFNGASDSVKAYFPEDSEEVQKEPDLLGELRANRNFHSQGMVWTSDINEQWSNRFAMGHLLQEIEFAIGDTGESVAAKVNYKIDNTYFREELTWIPAAPHQFTTGTGISRLHISLDLNAKDPGCTEFDVDCDVNDAERKILKDSFDLLGWYAYLKDQWRIVPDFTLSLGARFSGEDYLDETYTEPRLGAEWRLTNTTIVTAGWGKYHQFPDGGQVIEEFGNPELANLKATHNVLGVEHFINESWNWKMEGYYKTFDDLVVSTDGDPSYLNEGSGKAYGLELLLRKNPIKNVSGWLSLTLSHSERTNDLTNETFLYDLDR
ncbi:MAG: TonB-dependent receptor, partial [Gammaproteobacteria bacterium]|nr:TonB-dependent receptor [Gammaproteobacteria bacterium]